MTYNAEFTEGPILSRLWTKVHDDSDCSFQCTCPIVCIVFRCEDKSLKLPLSCEVVEKDGFGAPIFTGRGILISDMHF